MIKETITAIGMASRRAAVTTTARQDWTSQVAHVREWSFAMPHLIRLTVPSGPVHQIFVGPSRTWLQSLGRDDAARTEGLDRFVEAFKRNLLAGLSLRRPIINRQDLEPSATPQVLRGVRSFILRHQCAAGNLYLMADLASRREFETLRDEEWGRSLDRQLLPADLGRMECIDQLAMLDRVSTYLARCEQDIELLVPTPDGDVQSVSAVVLRQHKRDDLRCLQLSLDVDRRTGVEFPAGTELEGAFGAAGRVFRFQATCLGPSEVDLDGCGTLPTIDLLPPRRYHLDQRRRYYRVTPSESLSARLTVTTPAPGLAADASQPGAPVACDAAVLDLSFSGVGVACPGAVPEQLGLGAEVTVELQGKDLGETLRINGLVRRVHTRPCGRGKQETLVGVEFVGGDHADRIATQQVRQYVMARQRCLLAERSREPAGAGS